MTSLQFTKSPTGISCRYSARSQAVTGYGCDRNPASVSASAPVWPRDGGLTSLAAREAKKVAASNSNRGPSSQAASAAGANPLPAPVALFSPWSVKRGVWS